MSAVAPGIPTQIEQQLLGLDKQLRDAAFIRGVSRLIVGMALYLVGVVVLDAWLGLSGTIRGVLLGGWVVLAVVLIWRGVLRPMWAPVSFASLAAVVEQQFPELRERLTSLVELRGSDGTELAPGASRLMQDLLARQTVKAFKHLSIDQISFHQGPLRAALIAAIAVVLLMAPFVWNADAYGLLLSRFFAPWGNFSWGSRWILNVVEGDQVVARGSDVPIHVKVTPRHNGLIVNPEIFSSLRLNWRDERNGSDQRRFVWDTQTETFVTTLPRVQQSLSFDVTSDGARTGMHRVVVADPPVMTRFQMEIEPPPYTGLPARSLTSVPPEVRIQEASQVLVSVEFSEPVVEARLQWPKSLPDASSPVAPPRDASEVEDLIPLTLSADRTRGTAAVMARVSGAISILASNSSGLQNRDLARSLFVTPDEPPTLRLSGPDHPVFVRPDELYEQRAEINDDFGLSAVELFIEASTGIEEIQKVADDQLNPLRLAHSFTIDLTRFNLTGGQTVTYRIRAADNRTEAGPQVTWSARRTLMVNTSLPQLPDQELATEIQQMDDQLVQLRADLGDVKDAMTQLHQQTEREALGRDHPTDKNEQLDSLQNEQNALLDKLQHLGDRLAERLMTSELADATDQIAAEDLHVAAEKLQHAHDKPARDQLEPIAQAIDRLGAADKKLQTLGRHLNELNKLEQNLAELSRLAQRAERLAEKLEGLDQHREGTDNPADATVSDETARPQVKELANRSELTQPADPADPSRDEEPQVVAPAQKSRPATVRNDQGHEGGPVQADQEDRHVDPEVLQKLRDEGEQLSKRMDELLKNHPELLEAARRDKQERLNQLAQRARQLAQVQDQLAHATKQETDVATGDSPPTKPHAAQATVSTSDAEPTGEDQANQQPRTNDDASADRASLETGSEPQSSPARPQTSASDNPKGTPSPNRVEAATGPQGALEGQTPGDDVPESKQDRDPRSGQSPGADATHEAESDEQGRSKPESGETDTGSRAGQEARSPEAETSAPANEGAESKSAESRDEQAWRERGAKALKQQEQITRAATEQAIDLLRETGADSPATKEAADFARQAELARQQAQAGDLAAAAETARRAETAAEATNEQLNPDGQSPTPQSRQAEQLAKQQREMARELEELAKSPEAVRGARIEAQRRATAAAQQLSRELAETTETLKSAPLKGPDTREVAEAGDKARRATEQAEAAMRKAENAQAQKDTSASAQAAAEATEKLNEAANEVKPTPPRSPGVTPVPEQVGAKVAEATRQIKLAQMKLSQEKAASSSSSSPDGKKAGQEPPPGKDPAASAKESEAKPSDKEESDKEEESSRDQSQQEAKAEKSQMAAEKSPASSAGKASQKNSPQEKSAGQQSQKSSSKSDGSDGTEGSGKGGMNGEGEGGSGESPGRDGMGAGKPGGPPSSSASQSSSESSGKEGAQGAGKEGMKGEDGGDSGQSLGDEGEAGEKPGDAPSSSSPKSPSESSGKVGAKGTGEEGMKGEDGSDSGQSPGDDGKAGEKNGNSPSSSSPKSQSESSASQAERAEGGGSSSTAEGSASGKESPAAPSKTVPEQSQSEPGSEESHNSDSSPQGDETDSPIRGEGQDSSNPPSEAGSLKDPETNKADDEDDSPRKQAAASNESSEDEPAASETEAPSQLAGAAERFRQFAKLLRSEEGARKNSKQNGRSRNDAPSARSPSNEPAEPLGNGGEGATPGGTTEGVDLGRFEVELQQHARQNWGRLPGQLRTEILQGAGKKSHPEYADRIKSYFEQITRPAK
ncbi:hypothetical protein [Schlesneria sp.]|uniref:hypothetical protein n=1 Tax=Schlesneria sp. TaxID=2762018 RepID=UPI002F089A51